MSGYVFPVSNYKDKVNLHWGAVKGGSDIMAPRGTDVLNMQAGKVIESGWNSVGGNSVLIQGEDGNQYYYAHLDKPPSVKVGQVIPEGTYLGPVGNTGDASGGPTHLHLGIGPKILLGSDKYGGTGGDYDATALLTQVQLGSANGPTSNQGVSGLNRSSPAGLDYNNKDQVKQYIRYAAAQRGIDPEVAVKVADSEGLGTYVGDNNSSFGPYQLHYGGRAPGGNAVGGMGDTFTQQTGLDARDPRTIKEQIDFSLDSAKTNGWGAWHGAQRIGLGDYQGIGTFNGDPNQYGDFSNLPSTSTSKGGTPSQTPKPATGLPSLSGGGLSGGSAPRTGLPNLSGLVGAPSTSGGSTGLPPMIQMGNTYMTPMGVLPDITTPTIAPPQVQANTWLSNV